MCKFKETRIAKATLKRNKARDLTLFYIEINYKDTAIKISDSGTRIDKLMNGTEESVQKSAHMHLVTWFIAKGTFRDYEEYVRGRERCENEERVSQNQGTKELQGGGRDQ